MNGIWLDFERPIVELKKKIEELKGLKGVEDEIERLDVREGVLKFRDVFTQCRLQLDHALPNANPGLQFA